MDWATSNSPWSFHCGAAGACAHALAERTPVATIPMSIFDKRSNTLLASPPLNWIAGPCLAIRYVKKTSESGQCGVYPNPHPSGNRVPSTKWTPVLVREFPRPPGPGGRNLSRVSKTDRFSKRSRGPGCYNRPSPIETPRSHRHSRLSGRRYVVRSSFQEVAAVFERLLPWGPHRAVVGHCALHCFCRNQYPYYHRHPAPGLFRQLCLPPDRSRLPAGPHRHFAGFSAAILSGPVVHGL